MVQDIGDRRADTVLLAGHAVDRTTVQGLKAASEKSGVSFQYLVAKAAQESSLDAHAEAATSSAAGLFQFTRGTWLEMLKRFGAQYGYGELSRQILETPAGKLVITDKHAEDRILALRNDPEASALMAAEYARDNAATLEAALGRSPEASELYLAHFLGASGAGALLSAPAARPAAAILPAAAAANPAVFKAPTGGARTAAEVIALVRDRFDAQLQRYADAGTVVSDAAPEPVPAEPPPATAPNTGRFDLAAALGTRERSPLSVLMLDQLLRLIAADPMTPSDEESEDEADPVRPLSPGGLRGSDWADAISRSVTAPSASTARRAYDAPASGPRTLDDQI